MLLASATGHPRTGKENAMPPFYCIKFGLLLAALFMVAIVALFVLISALSSLSAKSHQDKLAHQRK